jgi:hypothetical protein
MMIQTTGRHSRARQWLHLALLLCLLPTSVATRAILTIVDFTSWSYRAEVADFANSLDGNLVYAASLMIPPDHPQLCTFPESLLDADNNTIAVELRTPVALLVSLGGCDPQLKAQIALEIQSRVSNALKYLVFYNNDPNKPDEIPSLSATNFESSGSNFESIGLVSVSTSAGSAILGRIEKLSVVTSTSPKFLSEKNRRWHLPMVLERVNDNTYQRGDAYDTTRATANSFYWFRFVLFTLLIVSPCCRAGYLWWAGGGRIQFRRNENGRIVGFQYIPPISYWFASNGAIDGASPVSNRLTEEQVLALPEISYKHPEGYEEELLSDDLTYETETTEEVVEEMDIVVSLGSADAEQVEQEEHGDSPLDSTLKIPKADEEQPTAESSLEGSSEEYATTCTTCSICIDEFEVGERIRLLPRCKHAFHTECIMPWLTERQGCCPLCKASVIQPEDGDDNNNTERSVDQEPEINLTYDPGSVRSGEETDTPLDSERDVPVQSEDLIAEDLGQVVTESECMPSSECGVASEHEKASVETEASHPHDATPFDEPPLHPESNLDSSTTMSAMNAEPSSRTVPLDEQAKSAFDTNSSGASSGTAPSTKST